MDLTIQSITMYTSWFMGIITTRVKRLNIHAPYFNVTKVINLTALIMQSAVYHGLLDE
jgi:hypothetical protein